MRQARIQRESALPERQLLNCCADRRNPAPSIPHLGHQPADRNPEGRHQQPRNRIGSNEHLDRREADRFGVVVSGSTLLYAADGTLLFRGGLTIARGHEGRGPAHDRILALVDGHSNHATAPTFGCALEDE